MKLIINPLETIDAKIFEGLQEFADKTQFKVEIFVDNPPIFTKDKKVELDELGDDVDILQLDDYDCISHFGRDFINLSKIAARYKKENFARAFYMNVPFYHTAILPIPFVYIGRKIEKIGENIEQIFQMNGTVDFTKNHLLIGGTNFQTNENYSVIFHELFHLLHDRIHGTYAKGKQTAHCTNFAGEERCIMNPPENVFYSPDKKIKREKLGKQFCEECTTKLEYLTVET